MSDTSQTPAIPPNKVDPSTFRQVVKNMERTLAISEKLTVLLESVGEVTELPLTIKDIAAIVDELKKKLLDPMDKGTGGDLVSTENGIKIIGIHVVTKNSDVDLLASEYPQGLTVELKNTAVIGLADKTGMVQPYCFMFTMKKDSPIDGEPETVDYSPMQVAFSNSMMYMYSRFADSPDGAWGEWKERQEQTIEPGENRQQIISSVNEPVGQVENEYWLQILDKGPDPELPVYMFEDIGDPTETAGSELDTVDADKLASEYDVM